MHLFLNDIELYWPDTKITGPNGYVEIDALLNTCILPVAHGAIRWLDDKCPMFLAFLEIQKVILEGVVLRWEDPGLWNEVVLLWMGSDHSNKTIKQILYKACGLFYKHLAFILTLIIILI